MIMPAARKLSQVLVSRMKDGHEESSMLPEVPMDSSPGLEAAADKIISAFHNKDAKYFVSSFKEFMDIYEAEKMHNEMSDDGADSSES